MASTKKVGDPGAWELFKRSWNEFFVNGKQQLGILFSPIFIPLIVLFALFALYAFGIQMPGAGTFATSFNQAMLSTGSVWYALGRSLHTLGMFGWVVTALVFFAAVWFLIGSAIGWIGLVRYVGKKIPSKHFSLHIQDAVRYFWPFIGVSLLVGLLSGIGMLLLIVPGVLLTMMFFLSPYIVLLEGVSPVSSLQVSKERTSGFRWWIFKRLFLYEVFVFILSLPVLIPYVGAVYNFLLKIALIPVGIIFTYQLYDYITKVKKKDKRATDGVPYWRKVLYVSICSLLTVVMVTLLFFFGISSSILSSSY